MVHGTKWTVSGKTFPRYMFFRNHLLDFLPRFQRIVAHGHLEDAVANGNRRLKEIQEYSECFKDHVTLSLFGTTNVVGIADVLAQLTEDDVKKESTTWSEFTMETQADHSFYDCHIVVCIIDSGQAMEGFSNLIVNIPAIKRRNIIIYNIHNKHSYFSTDIPPLSNVSSALTPTECSSSYIPTTDGSPEKLNRVIQNVLEEKVISFMDSIVTVIHSFVPKSEHQLSKTVIEIIGTILQSNLRKGFIIFDFYPRQPTDQDASSIEQAKLVDYIKRLFNVTLSELISRKFGLSTALVHYLLMEGYGLESKVDCVINEIQLQLKNHKDETAMKYCKHIGNICMKQLTAIAEQSERYMEEQSNVLDLMMQLEFELHGLMKLSKVPRKALVTAIPAIPTLPLELHHELLRIPGVESCGHLFGKLIFHVSQDVDDRTLVKTLKKHYYNFSFSTVRSIKSTQHCLIVRVDNLRSITF